MSTCEYCEKEADYLTPMIVHLDCVYCQGHGTNHLMGDGKQECFTCKGSGAYPKELNVCQTCYQNLD